MRAKEKTPDEIILETIGKAIKILAPPKGREDECRADVGLALWDIEFEKNRERGWSKKGKAAAHDLRVGLERVKAALKEPDLLPLLKTPPAFKRDGRVVNISFPPEMVALWIRHCTAIEIGEIDPHNPNDTGSWRGVAEICAATQAYKLMAKYGVQIVTTKRKEFETLAATLWGDPEATFHRYCLQVHADPPSDNNFGPQVFDCKNS